VRQSPITVRLGTDSVNPFRQQIYKSLVSVALKPQTAKPSAGLRANGFALLPIEAGAITEACPFHVSADARKEEDAQPDGGMVSRAWPRSSGIGHFRARCGFLNSIIQMRFGNRSGSLAILAAIRRASSFVTNLAAPSIAARLVFEIDIQSAMKSAIGRSGTGRPAHRRRTALLQRLHQSPTVQRQEDDV
jgi:hypothetical protein